MKDAVTFKVFKGDLDKEYSELYKLKKERKWGTIFRIINSFGILFILIFGIMLLHSLIPTFNIVISNLQDKDYLAFKLLLLGLSLGILSLLLVYILGFYEKQRELIQNLVKEINEKKIKRNNYRKKIKPLEQLVKDLKYKINIKEIQDNRFKNSLVFIKKEIGRLIFPEIRNQSGTYEIKEELNTYLYTIFNGEYNGYHSEDILKELNDKETLLELLYYITYALKKIDLVKVGDLETDEKKIEDFFLGLKKIIEKRFKQLRKDVYDKKENNSY